LQIIRRSIGSNNNSLSDVLTTFMSTSIRSLIHLPSLSPHGIDLRWSLAVFELTNSARPRVVLALPFAEQVRRALIRNRVDTSHSEAITGKTVAGVPLEGHEHAHYFATDEDGDGRLDHVTIYCPRGFDEADVEALGSLRTIYARGNRPENGQANRPEVRMILIGLGGVEMFARAPDGVNVTEPRAVTTGPDSQGNTALAHPLPQAVLTSRPSPPPRQPGCPSGVPWSGYCPVGSPILASTKRWRSVTPFSLPRFPNRGSGKPPRPRDLPEAQLTQELVARGLPVILQLFSSTPRDQLTQELVARGLPEPLSIKRIEGYQGSVRPMVRWLEFHTQRFKGTRGKGLAGFEIEFAEPVAGPIAVGFGCHFGLGLFMPCLHPQISRLARRG
jgi:hypothetical protein